jgi:putative ABC transport system ATP-binding protein
MNLTAVHDSTTAPHTAGPTPDHSDQSRVRLQRRAPVIEARGIRRTWGVGESATVALDGVDLSVGAGELVAVVGPSGSGKSTLGGVLSGIDRPDAGSVVMGDVRVDRMKPERLARWRARNVGIVFQEPNLMPVLTAEENVVLALQIAGVRSGRNGRRREIARTALRSVGLDGRGDRLPSQLSGGERQRVGVARAIAANPPLLVADEPTGSLDQANGHVVFNLIRGLATEGTSVVLITHDLDLAGGADRIVELVDGTIHAEVTA